MKTAYSRKRVAFHKLRLIILVGFFFFSAQLLNAQELRRFIPESPPQDTSIMSSNRSVEGVQPLSAANAPVIANPNSIQIQKNPAYHSFTPKELVEEIFIKKGGCALVENVTYKGHGWNGTRWYTYRYDDDLGWVTEYDNLWNRGLGYFSNTNPKLGMTEGLVLSTGDLFSLEGPNTQYNGTRIMANSLTSGSTDSDLQGLLSGSEEEIYNVSVLEFDFIPNGSIMQFKYIFSSEEYPTFVNRKYNDVFGFFVTRESTGEKKNIAVLPEGRGIVSINNVNDGFRDQASYNCTNGSNPSNSDYFTLIPGPIGSSCVKTEANMTDDERMLYQLTQLNGMTHILTASCEVEPCERYHLKLVIGNTGDQRFQSAVFLEANSFDIGGHLTNYGNDIENMDLLYRGCDNNKLRFSRAEAENRELSISVSYEGEGAEDIVTLDDQPLPTVITIPPGETYTDIHYKVKTLSDPTEPRQLDIVILCPCGEDAMRKTLWVYDSSRKEDFNVAVKPICPSINLGEIKVTGAEVTRSYEVSLDGIDWQSSEIPFTELMAGKYTVHMRDSGSCYAFAQDVAVKVLTANAGAPEVTGNGIFKMHAAPLNMGETGEWTIVSGDPTITDPNSPNTTVTLGTSASATLRWTVTTPGCSASADVTVDRKMKPPNEGSIHVHRDPSYALYTPEELIEKIFVKEGSCVSVSNVTFKGHGWDPATNQWSNATNRGLGYFSKGTSNFEMEEGLVLSTGDLRTIEGPNNLAGGVEIAPPGQSTDTDLESLVPTVTFNNVSVLEFDFTPTTSRVQFKYIFGSEEYSFFVNSKYNDIFGFFIAKKSGSSNPVNIAQLPQGKGIVSINNVNAGARLYKNHNCLNVFETNPYVTNTQASNKDYYINIPGIYEGGSLTPNDEFIECRPISGFTEEDWSSYKSIQLNGRTAVLTAEYEVEPCETYHLKLVIGNAMDPGYQSAVFLQAHSFETGGNLVSYGNDIEGMEHVFKGCTTNKLRISRPAADPTALDVNLSYSGSAVNGTDITDLNGNALPTTVTIPAGQEYYDISYVAPANSSGSKYFDVALSCSCGIGSVITKRIWIFDSTPENAYSVVASPSCSNVDNGTIQVSAIGGSGSHQVALDGGEWLSLPHTYQNMPARDYTLSLRDSIGCNVYTKVVTVAKVTANAGSDQISCNSTFTMDASALNAGEVGVWTVESGVADITDLNDPKTTITVKSSPATLKWSVSASGCTAEGEVTLTVKEAPQLSSATTFGVCSGENFTYIATSTVNPTTFSWSRAEASGISNPPSSGSTNIINETLVNTTGQAVSVPYVFTLTANGCTITETLYITVHARPKLQVAPSSSVCSGEEYSYSAAFDIAGTAIEGWEREAVENITPAIGSGATGLIKETLVNTANQPVDVTYKLSFNYFGCEFIEDIVVTVKPKPTLSSNKSPAGICTGSKFIYTAATATQGGNIIGWRRKAVSGISNAEASGTGASIDETLINTTGSPVEVTYVFTIEANGCTNEEEVKVWVTTQPVISIKNATANEGNELEFEVTLSGAGCAEGSATISYTTVDRAAVSPDDYTAVSGTLTFNVGETVKKIVVTTNPDDIVEGKETMLLRLSSANFCQLEGGRTTLDAIGTIEDRTDGAIMVEQYKPDGIDDASEPSIDGAFCIRFQNKNVTCTNDVRVEFTLSGAEFGIDYTVETSSIVSETEAIIKAGRNEVIIPIKVINNYIVQGARDLVLTLTKVEMLIPPS